MLLFDAVQDVLQGNHGDHREGDEHGQLGHGLVRAGMPDSKVVESVTARERKKSEVFSKMSDLLKQRLIFLLRHRVK